MSLSDFDGWAVKYPRSFPESQSRLGIAQTYRGLAGSARDWGPYMLFRVERPRQIPHLTVQKHR